ncbi:uncharacterized protein [Lolium perenne]|uniref:uncharacterized protein n=1 Tax=Lolium perenne TaxID=4522 RepID=UPI003A98E9B3
MVEFRKTLSFCNLHDLGCCGPLWTFDNKQKERRNVRARLDRDVASDSRMSMFPDSKVTNIVSTRSDHLPILLEIEKHPKSNRQPELPRYERMWEREPSLPAAIEGAWTGSPPCSSLGDLMSKLKNTRSHLKEWSEQNFGNVAKSIKKLSKKISSLWKRPISEVREFAVRVCSKELEELLHREEMMWRQRSRINWLNEGDRNTKYFHKKASWRQTKNRIKRISGANGNWTDDPAAIEDLATEFFKKLHTKDKEVAPDDLINLLHTPISKEMNAGLCKEFSDEEIGDALFQIGPLKAPRPDGMPGRFFPKELGHCERRGGCSG